MRAVPDDLLGAATFFFLACYAGEEVSHYLPDSLNMREEKDDRGTCRMIDEAFDKADGEDVALGRAGRTVRDCLVSKLKGVHEIEAEIVSLVRHAILKKLTAAGTVSTGDFAVIGAVVADAVQAIEETGAGLAFTIKSVAKGVVLGVSDVGGDLHTAAFCAVTAAMTAANTTGLETTVIASRAIRGVVEASTEMGRDTRAIAQMAVAAASEVVHTCCDTSTWSSQNIPAAMVAREGREAAGRQEQLMP